MTEDEDDIKKRPEKEQQVWRIKRDIKIAFKRFQEAPKTKLEWYKLGRVLGRGACSKVNLALHILTRKVVALKSVNKNYLEQQRLLQI